MNSAFIDTNIWLYAIIDCGDKEKTSIAREVIKNEKQINISIQVVNEVCINLIKKAKLSETEIEKTINSFYKNYQIVSINQKSLITACNLRKKHGFSFWDSFIICSAIESQSNILFSEDMQHNLTVEKKIKIINPFKLI